MSLTISKHNIETTLTRIRICQLEPIHLKWKWCFRHNLLSFLPLCSCVAYAIKLHIAASHSRGDASNIENVCWRTMCVWYTCRASLDETYTATNKHNSQLLLVSNHLLPLICMYHCHTSTLTSTHHQSGRAHSYAVDTNKISIQIVTICSLSHNVYNRRA